MLTVLVPFNSQNLLSMTKVFASGPSINDNFAIVNALTAMLYSYKSHKYHLPKMQDSAN